jgi:hypothetical protein
MSMAIPVKWGGAGRGRDGGAPCAPPRHPPPGMLQPPPGMGPAARHGAPPRHSPPGMPHQPPGKPPRRPASSIMPPRHPTCPTRRLAARQGPAPPPATRDASPAARQAAPPLHHADPPPGMPAPPPSPRGLRRRAGRRGGRGMPMPGGGAARRAVGRHAGRRECEGSGTVKVGTHEAGNRHGLTGPHQSAPNGL